MPTDRSTSIHGLLAEFETEEEIVRAAERLRERGYRRFEAYTPYPVDELTELIEPGSSPIPAMTLAGGLVGAAAGFGMQVYLNTFAYPIDVGGRPLFSWPAFIPITFELAVLLGAFGAFFGMFLTAGLPELYHPVFHVDRFERASQDRYFLCVEAIDAKFDRDRTDAHLRALEDPPERISVVPL